MLDELYTVPGWECYDPSGGTRQEDVSCALQVSSCATQVCVYIDLGKQLGHHLCAFDLEAMLILLKSCDTCSLP